MKNVKGQYNTYIDEYLRPYRVQTRPTGYLRTPSFRNQPSRNLLRYILQEVEKKAVTKPALLRNNVPFSAEVCDLLKIHQGLIFIIFIFRSMGRRLSTLRAPLLIT